MRDGDVTVMSFNVSHISSVLKAPVRTFSSKMRGSRKHVTEPMLRRCSLHVSCIMSLVGVSQASALAGEAADDGAADFVGVAGADCDVDCSSDFERRTLLLRQIC